ncbi:acetyltransferase, ribosomal protein N-acetylase [Bernardetia litoralis DSM 6794]|uniref:Acetyltransferase, ribosomal protein N-acetylase n=1 Tax=Bernardetia litoralis (strain ATCC 23117 / DSM 6794 / NBRC 15988 / NCIMB 1366 / Fx l1 / Sio-4) TaxID=880071 RepID=I4AL47_BERLS|nr:GNAT family N-acetyltransferase [Bernardetia litoralis]AFM04682.1 acetyltransferase, ribosomal protein N-acetylase [Bernardetia litoralis DSM 6794]
MKILETERLIIEEANLSDASFFLRLLNSPNWLEFIGDRNIKSLEDATKYVQESLIGSYKEKGFGFYKMSLRANNEPIGAIGFLKREYLEFPDIGYAILPNYESKGYVSEAAKAVLEYGKNKLQLKEIVAFTTEENLASQKILLKIGLYFIDKRILDGEECVYYSTEKC